MKRLTFRGVLDVPAIQEYLKIGQRCVVAVSGGADSVCLLAALHEMSRQYAVVLHAIHVNHLIRGAQAVADWEFVQQLCETFGVQVHYRTIEPLGKKPVGKTTEEYFREERHAQFYQVATEVGADVIAVGHSADDLAENMLMHLLRGAGLHGLTFSFSSPCRDKRFVRPLWKTSREKIVRYLAERELGYREDESNASLEFTRNKIRHVLIPFLEREFNPAVRDALQSTAAVLSAAQQHLRAEGMQRLSKLQKQAENAEALPLKPFLGLPSIIQLEVLHSWLEARLNSPRPLRYQDVENIRRFAASASARKHLECAGFVLLKTADSLFAITAGDASQDCSAADGQADRIAMLELARNYVRQDQSVLAARIPAPISCDPWNGPAHIDVKTINDSSVRVMITAELQPQLELNIAHEPADKSCPRLFVRNRLPGDRISRSIRLKTVLINDKIPYFIRDLLVLVTDEQGFVRNVVGMERINARLRNSSAYSVETAIVPQHNG